MFIRSAYWIGKPKAGQAERLKEMIDQVLVPAMREFPGVASAQTLWPDAREGNPPEIFCQVIVVFATLQDKAEMMRSEARAALRPAVLGAAALFDGEMSHIDFHAL